MQKEKRRRKTNKHFEDLQKKFKEDEKIMKKFPVECIPENEELKQKSI